LDWFKHWSIENNLHWVLDTVFKEDASLKKKVDSAVNYNVIWKLAMAIIDKEKSRKTSTPINAWEMITDLQY